MLTTGKRSAQAEKYTAGKLRAYREYEDRLLRLKWMALMLSLSVEIGRHVHEFEQVLTLPL